MRKFTSKLLVISVAMCVEVEESEWTTSCSCHSTQDGQCHRVVSPSTQWHNTTADNCFIERMDLMMAPVHFKCSIKRNVANISHTCQLVGVHPGHLVHLPHEARHVPYLAWAMSGARTTLGCSIIRDADQRDINLTQITDEWSAHESAKASVSRFE